MFLFTITSAWGVSELQALCVPLPSTIFFPGKLVLQTRASFLPKVVTLFHVGQQSLCCRSMLCITPLRRRRDSIAWTPKECSASTLIVPKTTGWTISSLCGSPVQRKTRLCRRITSHNGLCYALRSATLWRRGVPQKVCETIPPEPKLLPLH